MTITNNAAYEVPEFKIGFLEANLDLSSESSYQYVAVDAGAASGAGLLGPAALVLPSAGGNIIGVLQNNPALGEAGDVMVLGVSKVQVSGAFSVGAILKVDAAGKFLPATSGSVGVAKALQAGVVGSISSVLLGCYGVQP